MGDEEEDSFRMTQVSHSDPHSFKVDQAGMRVKEDVESSCAHN